jgi:hypothetical protein
MVPADGVFLVRDEGPDGNVGNHIPTSKAVFASNRRVNSRNHFLL